jgi:hypothetical protein
VLTSNCISAEGATARRNLRFMPIANSIGWYRNGLVVVAGPGELPGSSGRSKATWSVDFNHPLAEEPDFRRLIPEGRTDSALPIPIRSSVDSDRSAEGGGRREHR